MKKVFLIIVILGLGLGSCAKKTEEQTAVENPFFFEFETRFNVPPFDLIKQEHYMPAFEEGMKLGQEALEQQPNRSE